MRKLYSLLLYLAVPYVLARLFWRSRRAPAYRERWQERLGIYSEPNPPQGVIWVHAVSVGESQAAQPLIKNLMQRRPDLRILVTTTTPTGARRVEDLFGDSVDHVYTPYDLPDVVDRFLDRFRPTIALFMETEIWPNLLAGCSERKIPVILANARLSDKSARGYRKLGPLIGEALDYLTVIAVQGRGDANRFVALGASPDKVEITGSLKFDARMPASLHEEAEAMRRLWGESRPVWVAASTHEGEEEQVLEAHRRLLDKVPSALLVLVPRHPERFDRVFSLCEKQGFETVRRSEQMDYGFSTQVFLGDTMGELTMFMAASDTAFIGGSLVPIGGHNLLEPAALGKAIVHGPHMFNFSEISRMLSAANASVEVDSAQGLADVLSLWLSDASERSVYGENGRKVVADNRGSLGRLETIVFRYL